MGPEHDQPDGNAENLHGADFPPGVEAKKAEGESQLDTEQLVRLLNKDRALLTREDSQRVSLHFRAKVKQARQEAVLQEQMTSYADLIRDVLDYRDWYEFHLLYQRDGDPRKELTDRAFNKFSGGEKAMAMYVPLFAAVSAQYQKGGPQCPLLLALDEAFAGVDERNISAMFELVGVLDFDYIMNSRRFGLLCQREKPRHCRAAPSCQCLGGRYTALSLGWRPAGLGGG